MSRELNKIFDVKSRQARRDILDKFDLSKEDKNKVLNKIDSGGGDNKELFDAVIAFEGYNEEGNYYRFFCLNGEIKIKQNKVIPFNSILNVYEREGDRNIIISDIPAMTNIDLISYSDIFCNFCVTTRNIDNIECIAINANIINGHLECYLNNTLHNETYSLMNTGNIKFTQAASDVNAQKLDDDWCVILIASERITEDNMLTADMIRNAIKNNIIIGAFAFQCAMYQNPS